MASFAEAFPDKSGSGQDELYAEPVTYMVVVNGERHIFPDPGEFPWVFNAYLRNRNGQPPEDSLGSVPLYQDYLRTDDRGLAVTRALDEVCNDEHNRPLIMRAIRPIHDRMKQLWYYSQIIGIAAEYLPPELDARLFQDAPDRYGPTLEHPPTADAA